MPWTIVGQNDDELGDLSTVAEVFLQKGQVPYGWGAAGVIIDGESIHFTFTRLDHWWNFLREAEGV